MKFGLVDLHARRPTYRPVPASITRLTAFVFLLLLPALTGLAGERDRVLVRTVLATNLVEPIALDVAADGRIVFAERRGTLKVWLPDTAETRKLGSIPAFSGPEDGILGLALDPEFTTNGWFYLFHGTIGVPENRVSRFTIIQGSLLTNSQKILLRIPTLIPKPNHSGGCLGFDGNGNLYASTGDYTIAGQSDGFAPLDRRPGHALNNSERTAANSADFRGKILRIHPEPDGTYTIPTGNLFAPGTPRTLPEIYIMGCRNPFRFSIDPVSGRLFWGDVGPDALGPNPTRGPAGFDEFNMSRSAGNFGWPYFSADNRPYVEWNFETRIAGKPVDPLHPVNDSPNNTGVRELPAARSAFLWYPPAPSTRWPELGSGPRSAMAGAVFHFDPTRTSPHQLPAEFDGAVFLFEWERGWIKAAWLNADGQLRALKPFMQDTRFKRPICLRIGRDGALYLIEWGSNWADNKDAALVRLGSQAADTKP